MNKRFLGCAVALATMASVVTAQERYSRMPEGTPIYEVNVSNVANGGTLVYDNSFPQISPAAGCAGLSCEACGSFYTTAIWTTGNNRYYSDDITLGAGPRQLVRYNFMVCGANSVSTLVDITSSLWTVNLSGLPGDAPGAPITGTQSVTQITVPPPPGACFIIEVKVPPGIVLPESMHLVVTSSLQAAAGGIGTSVAVLEAAEYGANANQHRRSLAGLATQPDPNDNADWAGAAFFTATPNCPSPTSCTTGCVPYAAAWAHIYADEGTCGDGVVGPGEQCDNSDPCCIGCQIATAGTTCRSSTGACDPAETCDGTNTACPADEISDAGVTCRISSGPCDLAEACDGISVDCPADQTITMCIDGDGCCPIGCDNSTDDDCPPAGVPTVSEWGLAILLLIGLIAGTVLFNRRRVALN